MNSQQNLGYSGVLLALLLVLVLLATLVALALLHRLLILLVAFPISFCAEPLRGFG